MSSPGPSLLQQLNPAHLKARAETFIAELRHYLQEQLLPYIKEQVIPWAKTLPAQGMEQLRILREEGLPRAMEMLQAFLQYLREVALPTAIDMSQRLYHYLRENLPRFSALAWAKSKELAVATKNLERQDFVNFGKAIKDPENIKRWSESLRQRVERLLDPEKLSTNNRVRLGASVGMAFMVTVFLFFFMQTLINTGERIDQRLNVVKMVDATMPNLDMDLLLEVDQPEPIEEVVQDQEEIPEKMLDFEDIPTLNLDTSVAVDSGLDIGNASVSSTDGEYLPIVTIAAEYPERAAQRGIEGWCLVSFTVDGTGNVVADTIVVVDADPPNLFDRSSIRAARRFRFQPRVIDGRGVEVPGVTYLFTYELEDDGR